MSFLVQSFSLINRSATKEFPITKGVRQGDPLSRFLFIIAMEVLSSSMKSACQNGLFHGINTLNDGPLLFHILYVDDAIFVGNWTSSNFQSLVLILR